MKQPVPVDAIEVGEAGALTTVQDLGRYGYQRYGVPVSGAMDSFALKIANLLVGNDEGAAGLEVTIVGPTLRFLIDAVVAVTGGDLRPMLGDVMLPMWEATAVFRGSTLAFREQGSGARAYVAVSGGIDVPLVLGSRSTFLRSRLGGFHGRALQPADRLTIPGLLPVVEARRMPARSRPIYARSQTLRVILGPQQDSFPRASIDTFLSSSYEIGRQSDRMGYRLEGPRVMQTIAADIISDGTPPGAVQITGDGLPILLLADRGTAGGYTKIATIITADLPRVAQMMPGDRARFRVATDGEARAALEAQRSVIDSVKRSRRRCFRRRRLSARTPAGEWHTVTGFEEDREDRAWRAWRERAVHVTVSGTDYVVEQALLDAQATVDATIDDADSAPVDESTRPGPDARAAGAALAVAMSLGETEEWPRDWPIVG